MFQPLLDGYLPFSLFSIAITETKSCLFENYLWSVAVLYKIFIHHSVSWDPFGLECTLNFSPWTRTTWFLFIVCSSRNGHEYVFMPFDAPLCRLLGKAVQDLRSQRGSGPTRPICLPVQACAFWPSCIGLGSSWGAPAASPLGCQTILGNDLQKNLLALILNSPLLFLPGAPDTNPAFGIKPFSSIAGIHIYLHPHFCIRDVQRHQPRTTTHPSKGWVKTGPKKSIPASMSELLRWIKFTAHDRKRGINPEVWRAKHFQVIKD